MAIKFTNIRTGEVKVATTEPMIAAYYNSGNQHPNALLGQDFGWRLAPETVKKMLEIKSNPQTLNTLAATFNVMLEDLKESHILHYISIQEEQAKEAAQEQDESVYAQKYEDEVRALERGESRDQSVKKNDTGNDTIEVPSDSADDETTKEEKSNAQ